MRIVLLLLAVLLFGCTNLEPAKTSANATRDIGIAGAKILDEVCTKPYEQAKTKADIAAVDARGCQHAAMAYDGLRAAHTTLVGVIRATESAQCNGVSKAARECNIAGAYLDLAKAASEWAAAVEEIQRDSKPAEKPQSLAPTPVESFARDLVAFVLWEE